VPFVATALVGKQREGDSSNNLRERSVSDAQSLLMLLLLLQREDYVIFAKSVHPKYVAGRMHYTCY
jgi:hypothetical protein